MPRKGLFLLLALAASSSCKRERTAPARPDRSESSIQSQVDAVIPQLATICGLSPKQPIRVRLAKKDELVALTRERLARYLGKANTEAVTAMWKAFGFSDGTPTPESVAAQATADARVTAFYDPTPNQLALLDRPGEEIAVAKDGDILRELALALQDQNLGAPEIALNPEVDKQLPQYALREGAADAAATAFFGQGAGVATIGAIDKWVQITRAMPLDSLIERIGFGTALGRAPLLVRDEIARGRAAGFDFVAMLVRTGGFALVNQAFTHPPSTMNAVYEPWWYASGHNAVSFKDVPAPSEYRQISSGELGVVGVMAFFERCIPMKQASRLPSGWAGDHFQIYARPGQDALLLWTTTWTDEQSAIKFSEAITGSAQCQAPGTDSSIRFETLQRGRSVAVLRGAPSELADKLLTLALGSVGVEKISTPPLGPVKLQLQPTTSAVAVVKGTVDVAGSGTLHDGQYSNSKLGFSAKVPSGFNAATDQLLDIDHGPPALASGRVAFEPSSQPFDNSNDFFEAFASGVSRRMFGGVPIREESAGTADLSFGRTPYRNYVTAQGRPVGVRIMVLPLCDRRAALIITEVWNSPEGRDALDAWVRSFQLTAGPSICRDV